MHYDVEVINFGFGKRNHNEETSYYWNDFISNLKPFLYSTMKAVCVPDINLQNK